MNPKSGDIWEWTLKNIKNEIRLDNVSLTTPVLVIEYDDGENAYLCMSLESGDLDHWYMDDPAGWRQLA